MRIIKAELKDLNSVVPLFDQYREFYELTSDIISASSFIEARLKNEDSVIFLAITEQDGPAGFVQLYPSFSSLSMKRLWILNDLFVSPSHRQKKIAQELLKQAEEYAKITGAKGLTLMTAIDNHPAQNLYLTQGWKQVTKFLSFTKSV